MKLPFRGRSSLPAFCLSAVLMACIGHASAVDTQISNGARLMVGDFNGDFLADIFGQGLPNAEHSIALSGMELAAAQRWRDGFLALTWNRDDRNVIVGDFNGDASSDVLLQAKTAASLTELVRVSEAGELGERLQSIGDFYLGVRWDAAHAQLISGDFNGDGRDDVLLQPKMTMQPLALALSSVAGTFDALKWSESGAYLGIDWSAGQSQLIPGDFDGDGVTELLIQPVTGNSVNLADSRGAPLDDIFTSWPAEALELDWRSGAHRIVTGDFDGDGADDLMLLATQSGGVSAFLPSVNGQFPHVGRWLAGIPDIDLIQQILVGDFDGDGIDESLLLYADRDPVVLLANEQRRQAIAQALAALGLMTANQHLQAMVGTMSEADAHATADMAATPTVAEGHTTFGTTSLATTDSELVTAAAPVSALVATSAIATPNAVGRLEGVAGVSGGAATYSIPIVLPPGRNGMQPSVSLSYSSRAGNGVVGMGWSLNAGQSSIHRCPATVAQDGYAVGTRLTSEDKLCLDGQRLVVVSGTYGVTGAVYRTEIESYVRVTQNDVLTSTTSTPKFTVEYNDGRKATYAKTVVPTGVAVPQSWLMTQLVDANNNAVHYKYGTTAVDTIVDGEALLWKIYYTGTGAVQGVRQVQFVYEARPDQSISYFAAGKTNQTQRLSKIVTATGPNATDTVREYTLAYADRSVGNNTQRSLLEQVQECAIQGGSPYCLQPTAFSWDKLAPVNQAEINVGVTVPADQSLSVGGDYDGDGRREVVTRPWLALVGGQLPPAQASINFLNASYNSTQQPRL